MKAPYGYMPSIEKNTIGSVPLFYRRKYYIVKNHFVEDFNHLFNNINLPNQLKHGTRFVGRWMMPLENDETEIFAIWEYDSKEDYQRIEKNVRSDEAHVARINQWFEERGGRAHLGKTAFVVIRDEEIFNTVPA
ncbi:MAG: NIPSNAP family protein [Reinekea sp.]|nr:NIPSNAP family protein [Reinekea sp.]